MSSLDRDAIETLYSVAWAAYTLVSVVVWVSSSKSASSPGGVIYHTVSFSIYLTTLIYSAGSLGVGFLESWPRDTGTVDLTLARYGISLVQLTSIAVLLTYRPHSEALLVLAHVAMCALCVGMWVFSALAFEERHRFFWGWGSIALSVTVFSHVYSESAILRHSIYRPFKRMIVACAALYTVLYYVVVLWGPLYSGMINSLAQEIVLVVCDVLLSLLLFATVSHYSWTIDNQMLLTHNLHLSDVRARSSLGPVTFPNYAQAMAATGDLKTLADIEQHQYALFPGSQ